MRWDNLSGNRRKETKPKEPRFPRMCEECGQNLADPPSLICVGCDAYKDHQR